MKNQTIRQCDKCSKEDSINSISGLCPSCENEALMNDIEFNEDIDLNEQANEDISNLLIYKPRAKKIKEDVLKGVFD